MTIHRAIRLLVAAFVLGGLLNFAFADTSPPPDADEAPMSLAPSATASRTATDTQTAAAAELAAEQRGVDPVELVSKVNAAAASHDWQALLAIALGLLALLPRRLTFADHFFHTATGTLLIAGGIGAIGMLVPVLQAHRFLWPDSLVTAVFAGLGAALTMMNARSKDAAPAPVNVAAAPAAIAVLVFFALAGTASAHEWTATEQTLVRLVDMGWGGAALWTWWLVAFFALIIGVSLRKSAPSARRTRNPGPAAAVLLLALCAPAHADYDPHTAALKVPDAIADAAPVSASLIAVAPQSAPAVVAQPAPAPDIATKLAASDAALHSLASILGVPMPTTLPPAWLDTTAGKAITGVLMGLGAAVAVATTAAQIDAQFFPAK